MFQTKAYMSRAKGEEFFESMIVRRELGPQDILIEAIFVGINQYDFNNSNNESSLFPIVPGMEVTGIIQEIGSEVVRFNRGNIVGVGKIIDSCRECEFCENKQEQYCKKGPTYIYNNRNLYDHNGELNMPTFGGLSQMIVVNQNYIVTISGNVNLANVTTTLFN